MTYANDNNNEKIVYDYNTKEWKYPNEEDMISIDGYKRKVCKKCGKPCITINGIDDADFCLQGLTSSDFITNACCGHGDDSQAYISLADGRRFILDTDWSRKENNTPFISISVVDELPECLPQYFGLLVKCDGVLYIALKSDNCGNCEWMRYDEVKRD